MISSHKMNLLHSKFLIVLVVLLFFYRKIIFAVENARNFNLWGLIALDFTPRNKPKL